MNEIPRRRVIMLLSLILLTAFLSISILNYVNARNSMKTEIVNSSLPLLRENIYSTILRDLLPSMHTASLMSNDSFLIEWARGGEADISAIQDYLTRIRDRYGYISAFFVSEATGAYYHPTGIHKTISRSDEHDIWYYSFISSGKPFDLDVDSDQAADDRLTIFINYRLEDLEGRLLGVTGVGLEMNGFSGFLTRQRRLFDRQIYLVDETGYIQAHSDPSLIEKLNIRDIGGLSELADDILTRSVEPFSGQFSGDRRRIIVTSRYIPEIDWFIIVEHDQYAAMAEVRRQFFQSLLIGMAAFALVLALTLVTFKRYDRSMEALILTDTLTGASNRRAMDSALPRMLYRSRRHGTDLSMLMFDLDNFKDVNDRFGHQEGDRVLREFAGIAMDIIREDDLLVRWGGDEFLIASETDLTGASRIAKDVIEAFEGAVAHITLSCGIAVATDAGSPEELVRKADQAMYAAKAAGRGRIEIHREPPEVTQT